MGPTSAIVTMPFGGTGDPNQVLCIVIPLQFNLDHWVVKLRVCSSSLHFDTDTTSTTALTATVPEPDEHGPNGVCMPVDGVPQMPKP